MNGKREKISIKKCVGTLPLRARVTMVYGGGGLSL